MIKQYLFVLVALVLSMTNQVAATTVTFNTVEEIIRYGIEHNLDIQSKQLQWEASQQLPHKLGSLADPMIGIRLNGTPAKNSGDDFDQKRYVINQSFPFWGELEHLKMLGDSKAALAYIDYYLVHNKVAFSVESLVYKLQLNKELIGITEKNKKILTQLANIADVKYRAGRGLQANVLKARVSKGKLDEELLSLTHQKTRLTEALKSKLNIPINTEVSIFIDLPETSTENILAFDQKWANKTLVVQKFEALKHKRKAKVKVENDRFLPNFSAQLEVWDTASMEEQYSGQFMMTVPWFNSKNASSVDEATKLFEASERSSQDSIKHAQSLLKTLVSDINTTLNKMALYETQLLRDARLSLSNFQKSFEVDRASFIDYFEAEETLFQLEKKHAVLKNRYFTQVSALKWQFKKGEIPYE